MNFVKTSVALAAMAAFAAPAMAAPTLYGKLNLAVQNADMGDGSVTDIHNAASRLGVKGGAEIADGLKVIYQAEFQVNVADGEKEAAAFGKRNQFIGLEANFGTILMGRNDTMMKQSQGKVDQFGDLAGDLKTLFKGENRIGETMTYLSPSIMDIKFGVTVALQSADKQGDDNGYSLAAMYGDKKLKKSPVYASFAYDSDVAGYDIMRATVQGKVAGLVLGGMYQNQEMSDGSATDESGFLFSAAYKLGNWTPKVQYQTLDKDASTPNALSLGADYKLGSATKAYAFYTSKDMDTAGEDDHTYLGLGLEHKF